MIVVSGDLGSAYGLKVLQEKRGIQGQPKNQPDLDSYTYLIEQLKPEARLDIVMLLSELKIKPTSVDISDGLSSELYIYVAE